MIRKKYPTLMSPIVLGNVMLRNRIIAAPQSLQKMPSDGLFRRQDSAFFEIKAQGGCSVVTVGDCIVHGETGKAHPERICLDHDSVIPALGELSFVIRRHGAVASIELNHAGRFANRDTFCMDANGKTVYGPSKEILEDGSICHEMDEKMIEDIIGYYRQAARRVKAAGFNMINIHGAHGWLLSQFMSSVTNQRDDKWGGSFENRMRLTDRVIEAVRSEVGVNFPVEIRINGKEGIPGGYGVEEAIRIAKHLESKVQLINISAGNHEYMEAMLTFISDMFKPQGHLIDITAAVKNEVNVPIAAVGGIVDPEFMEEVLASGKADLIEIGRGTLAEPEFAKKIMQGREDEIIKCMRCYACAGEECEPAHLMGCAFNPRVGREHETRIFTKAERPRKILVAGAGPAGMEFAITAAKRGHKVTVCEKSNETGGLICCEEHVPFKKKAFEFSRTQKRLAERAGVDIRLNTPVTPEFVEKFAPEVLVAAIGSDPFVPPIPGVDGSNVILATKIPDDLSGLGNKVVVLGGGLVGAENAIRFAIEGMDVTIVEMRDHIAVDANVMHGAAIQYQIRDLHIKTITGVSGSRIIENGLYGVDKDGREHFYEADTVVLAVGMKPKWIEVMELQKCVNEFYQIGDCYTIGKIKDATTAGYQLAFDI